MARIRAKTSHKGIVVVPHQRQEPLTHDHLRYPPAGWRRRHPHDLPILVRPEADVK
jgi:hypothetical protein